MPSHGRWIVVVIASTTAAAIGYFLCASQSTAGGWPGGSSPVGLVLGIAAAFLILFECLLWPRKWPRIRSWRIGRTQTWMRAHIWLGILCVPLVVLHHGLSFNWGGSLTFVLMLLFWGVILSGLFGLYLQQVLPSYMLHALPGETIVSQIPHLSQQMVEDAERLLAKASGVRMGETQNADPTAQEEEVSRHLVVGAVRSVGRVKGKVLETQSTTTNKVERRDATTLQNSFTDTIKLYLLTGNRAGNQLVKTTQAATFFSALRSGVSGEAHSIVDILEESCDTRRQYDQQLRVHRLLHGWMAVHLPLSIALVVLLIAHILSAIRYAGIWPV
ncbi:MAG: hypothetical protein ACR2NU_00140 [Aeoliella sp.]